MKKGFTLIELLAVIIIISILVTLSGFAISKVIRKSKNSFSDYQNQAIIDAARILLSDNSDKLTFVGECKYISLNYLYSYGILDNEIISFKDNSLLENFYVKVCIDDTSAYGEDKLTYEVISNTQNLNPIFSE